jgi:lipoprotein NlpD
MRTVALAALGLVGCIPSVDAPPGRSGDAARYPPIPQAPLPEQGPDWQRRDADEAVTTLPAPRPAWEARPVIADATTVEGRDYQVRPGDTLNRIANATGGGPDAIARANGLEPPYRLTPGQRLTVPGGRYHLVRPGESGIAIARAYGVPWARVVEANGLAEPFILRSGQRVLIPAAPAGAGPSTAAQRAAAFKLDIEDIVTGGEPALATNQAPAKPAATPKRVLPSTAAVAPPARLAGGFIWPVEGRIVTRFGPGAAGERQNGVNISVPLGTPVRASADGVVAYAGSAIPSLGGLIIVKHGGGWTTVYGYAARLLVQRGQAVKRGQSIAVSGQTGGADRPAVHFELRRGRTPVDPQSQLPPL